MKNKLVWFSALFCLISLIFVSSASPPSKNQSNKLEITKQECYCPIAVGAVRLENGVGTIEHAGLDWDSIPVFSLYLLDGQAGATITVCWAVSSRMQICSSDPNDNSIYSFAIYNGKAPGVIFPALK